MEITVWELFFMMLMVIPTSRMLSSIFMKLISRVGTINEDRYALMGMGTLMNLGKSATNALRRRGGGGGGGGKNTALRDVSYAAPPDGGGTSGDGAPSNSILDNASGASKKAGLAGMAFGGMSPVAGGAVAPLMGLATWAMANPVTTMYGLGSSIYSRARELRSRDGLGRHDAMVQAAMDYTGASTRAEANARLFGAVIGSPFGATGAKIGSSIGGYTTSKVNEALGWFSNNT